MIRRTMLLYFSLVLCGLSAGCGGETATQQVPAPLAPTPAAELTEAIGDGAPTTTPQTSAATAAAPSPPAEPAAAAPSPPAEPAAAPSFPEAQISADNAGQIELLWTVGMGEARVAAIAPDNRLVAVGTSGGLAIVELPGPQGTLRVARFDPIAYGVDAVAFSADGQTVTISSGGWGQPARHERRRVSDGIVLETLEQGPAQETLFNENHNPIANSPDGALQAVFPVPDTVFIPGVTVIRQADGATVYADGDTSSVAFNANSTLLALVTSRGTLRVVDLARGGTSELPMPGYWSTAFSPDGLALAGAGRELQIWDVVSGAPLDTEPVPGFNSAPGMFAGRQRARYSPDGQLTVEGEYPMFEASSRLASVWRPEGAGYAHSADMRIKGAGFMDHQTYVSALSPAAGASAETEDGQALVVRAGAASHALSFPGVIRALEFSPDGAVLAVGDLRGAIRFVTVADGALLEQELRGDAGARSISFSADGQLLAAQFDDGAIIVWRLGEPQPMARLREEAGPAEDPESSVAPENLGPAMIFSSDQSMLLVAGRRGVAIFRLSSGQLLRTLSVAATDIAIGPRRRLIAIARDGYIELWGVRPSGGQQPGEWSAVDWQNLQIPIPPSGIWTPDTMPGQVMNGAPILAVGRVRYPQPAGAQFPVELPVGPDFSIVQFSGTLDAWIALEQQHRVSENLESGIKDVTVAGREGKVYRYAGTGIGSTENMILKIDDQRLLHIFFNSAAWKGDENQMLEKIRIK